MTASSIDPLRSKLASAVAALASGPRGSVDDRTLEPILEAAYAQDGEDRPALRRIQEALARVEQRQPVVAAWAAVIRLQLAADDQRDAAFVEADAAVAAAPAWTRLMAGAEAARLAWDWLGAASAWSRIERLDPAGSLRALLPLGELRRESPLLLSSLTTSLALAAVRGRWEVFGEVDEIASGLYAPDSSSAVRLALLRADALQSRGRYARALDVLSAAKRTARGDLRVQLLCSELHVLVALGRESGAAAHEALASLRAAQRTFDPDHALSARERTSVASRLTELIACSPELSDLDEPSDVPERWRDARANRLVDLLRREEVARGRKVAETRVKALLDVLTDAERALLDADASMDPSEVLRLRLLWCRVVVDIGAHETFDECEHVLEEAADESRQRGFGPLEMLAWDQRAVLRSRRAPPDWVGAVEASTTAAGLAADLIGLNASGPARGVDAGRSMLERLIPVLDRVIEIHVDGAMRVAEQHPELLREPVGLLDRTSFDEESPRGTWLRFGRILHEYAEQSQGLALKEARLAYGEGVTRARSLAFTFERSDVGLIGELSRNLRPTDAVIQYLLVGRYVVVFAYGPRFVDWFVQVVEQDTSAERAVARLVDEARAWTQGGDLDAVSPASRLLHELLLPEKIVGAIATARARHLRLVPHGALYRVPFGRLLFRALPLGRRFSLSLHPTGALAVASARRWAPTHTRPHSLGQIVGPEPLDDGQNAAAAAGLPRRVSSADAEEEALRRGVGTIAPIARVTVVDGTRSPLAEVLTRLGDFSLLHFTCHGREGGPLGGAAHLLIGNDLRAGLDPGAISRLRLDGCALALAQSCSTGWMDHRRSDPVQGMPQAFCDAGAAAFIAPLTKVPFALVAIFSGVYYRTLRFLPSEMALRRTLECFRIHGAKLVARDGEARRAFEDHGGSMDAFEYRYTGTTGIVMGNWRARAVGRLSFWWFSQRLRWGA